MKTKFTSQLLTLALLAASLISLRAVAATNLADEIELVRATYQSDRQGFVIRMLDLDEAGAEAFRPVYQAYRKDMDKIGDELVKVVLEYADVYPDVPEKQAARLLKQYTALEQKLADTRAKYLKRAAGKLPAAKVLRWAQLENRLDLALRMQLAGQIPLVPKNGNRP